MPMQPVRRLRQEEVWATLLRNELISELPGPEWLQQYMDTPEKGAFGETGSDSSTMALTKKHSNEATFHLRA